MLLRTALEEEVIKLLEPESSWLDYLFGNSSVGSKAFETMKHCKYVTLKPF